MIFRVWAPRAHEVDVEVDGARHPMAPQVSGTWEADVPGAGHGSDYGFRLDGSALLPDPRSRWQPAGPHGPSRVVDPGTFRWTDDGWRGIDLRRVVLYELHVGTFSGAGTFDGAVEHLDHLVDLGVGAIEILPVAQTSGARNWGYDGVDLYAAHHDYGGPAGLARLVDACHARGLGVILDVVYNHLGPEGNHLGRFGPYFTDFYRTPWGDAVNYDQAGSDEVRRFVLDNAVMWLRDLHLDGLRLDAVDAIVDTSATHVLEELRSEVDALSGATGRRYVVIAESGLNDPRIVDAPEVGGYGIDAQWSDDFHHALHVALTGERAGYYEDFRGLADLAVAFERAWVYVGQHSGYRGRRHGRAHRGLPGSRFLAYAQNHDQVGNRAAGDRLSHSLPPDRLRVAAVLYLLSPFVPMVFQGEEWGASTPFQYFTSHQDRELGRAVAQGRRREFASFGWPPDRVPDPQDPDTFARSKLDWDEPGRSPHDGLLDWYRRCIALRHALPDLADDDLTGVRAVADDRAGTLVVTRGRACIAANLGPRAAVVTVPGGRVLLASFAGEPRAGSLVLPPDSVAVLGP